MQRLDQIPALMPVSIFDATLDQDQPTSSIPGFHKRDKAESLQTIFSPQEGEDGTATFRPFHITEHLCSFHFVYRQLAFNTLSKDWRAIGF